MKRKSIFVLLFMLSIVSTAANAEPFEKHITEKIASSIVTAIEDEIYVLNHQHSFADIGQPVNGEEHRMPVYIKPTLNHGHGWVIYKLMPYGEVIRMFKVQHGMVILHGNPINGFPPTQPDYLTVYMSDDELCSLKRTWIRRYFIVSLKPSKQRMDLSRKRQEARQQ